MKYGETLRQRSIPAWSHHNIDYDEIKLLIKQHTTPGQGKAVSVPGRHDDQISVVEQELFAVFVDQHSRIGLFVKSKAGEIQRRLDHSKKLIRQLARLQIKPVDNRIPVARLERYGRLEDDVLKAGEEIKSLARFVSTQRTALRKLLKKYKKWTGSSTLEDRLREDVLSDPKSFTKLDLGPLLDDFSATRQSVRTLYDNQVRNANDPAGERLNASINGEVSTARQLRNATDSGSKVQFDAAIATTPLGVLGTFANYFVHPDSLVELQMLLLQHARFFSARSRSSSVASPVSSPPERRNSRDIVSDESDYHLLSADNLGRFLQEQSALTINDREHSVGSRPHRARATVRWNNDEEALAIVRSGSGKPKSAMFKKKHALAFFDKNAMIPSKIGADSANELDNMRRDLVKDPQMQPLFRFSSCRSRFVGLNDDPESITIGTLDTNIVIEQAEVEADASNRTAFPFALLLVRQEGPRTQNLLTALDNSYLVERVRGFSLEYHAIWQTLNPQNMSPPFWLPILTRDIRKLPPPMAKRGSPTSDLPSGARSSGSRSSTGLTEGTTAVDTTNEQPLLEEPTLRSFRRKKKRRLGYDTAAPQQIPQQRYWSEYDHPEDGDAEDAYVIYIDPNERSSFDRFFERLGSIFRRKRPESPTEEDRLTNTPPNDDASSSSDNEESALVSSRSRAHLPSFGTFLPPRAAAAATSPSRREPLLPRHAAFCFAASLAILIVAFTLAFTGRHKLMRAVDAGILFSVLCSLGFTLSGLRALVVSSQKRATGESGIGGSVARARSQRQTWTAWSVSFLVLLANGLGCGVLLARIFE